MTRASHATGVKVSDCSAAPTPGRAEPAISAVPLTTASIPEAVLKGCSSNLPLPDFSQALATSMTTPRAVVMSPRQMRGVSAAKRVAEALRPISVAVNSRARRRDMDGKNLGTEAGLGIGAQLWAIEAVGAPFDVNRHPAGGKRNVSCRGFVGRASQLCGESIADESAPTKQERPCLVGADSSAKGATRSAKGHTIGERRYRTA